MPHCCQRLIRPLDNRWYRAFVHKARIAIERDYVAFCEAAAAERASPSRVIDGERRTAGEAHFPQLARDDRGVGRAAAMRGQNPCRDGHTCQIVGSQIRSNEDQSPVLPHLAVQLQAGC